MTTGAGRGGVVRDREAGGVAARVTPVVGPVVESLVADREGPLPRGLPEEGQHVVGIGADELFDEFGEGVVVGWADDGGLLVAVGGVEGVVGVAGAAGRPPGEDAEVLYRGPAGGFREGKLERLEIVDAAIGADLGGDYADAGGVAFGSVGVVEVGVGYVDKISDIVVSFHS